MRALVFGLLTFVLVGASFGQPLNIRGRVVDAKGVPVPDAVVELKVRGTATKTAADGSFILDANAALGPGGEGPFEYRLDAGFLVLAIRSPLELRMEVIDGRGRSLGGLARRLEAGRHRIALAEAMPAPGRSVGLYFLRLSLGGQSFIHAFFHSGSGTSGTVFAPAYPSSAAKRAVAVDSLRIRKDGYRESVREIASYTAGDLGDLILSALPDDGSVCAKQHAEHTADGIDVVVCDALFDAPPRVHLPTTSAPTAYVARTADGFVTVSGETYPFATGGSSDPEIRRHASALYEIKLQNGKVESFRPAILFAESLFLAPLKGQAFEGLISQRTNGKYGIPTLPVRVQVLAERFLGGTSNASAFELKVAISNLAGAVAASDGKCMPALSSYGSQAPFDAGSEVLLAVGRVPSMHAFGDDEFVFELYVAGVQSGNIMAREWFFTPLDLVKNTLAISGTYTGVGHGAPGTIPLLDLHLATGGGGACNPQ
ncbi:MAG: carboxypeptidase regulatory-like domain-containing protein [Fibrobacteres bacterium]|nr:carboxypeptidase regulatory-like domain-containing protein [Fibrobacterota bacterium]